MGWVINSFHFRVTNNISYRFVSCSNVVFGVVSILPGLNSYHIKLVLLVLMFSK